MQNIAIRGKNTIISMVIVPLEPCKQQQRPLGCLNSNILIGKTYYSGNFGLPDTAYLRFPVRKLAESFKVENISIPGAELTKIHITVEIVKASAI